MRVYLASVLIRIIFFRIAEQGSSRSLYVRLELTESDGSFGKLDTE